MEKDTYSGKISSSGAMETAALFPKVTVTGGSVKSGGNLRAAKAGVKKQTVKSGK